MYVKKYNWSNDITRSLSEPDLYCVKILTRKQYNFEVIGVSSLRFANVDTKIYYWISESFKNLKMRIIIPK